MDNLGLTLLHQIQQRYQSLLQKAKRLEEIEAMASDLLDYKTGHEYAQLLGEVLSEAYRIIDAGLLPGGRMPGEIARTILQPTMGQNYEAIVKLSERIQTALNQQAGIGLRAVLPPINQDRIDGLAKKIGAAEHFEDVSWLLGEPIVNFSQSVVDDVLRENAEFQYRSGLKPRIIREAEPGCCKWCSDLAGTYDYPGVPKDVYRRHQNCRCVVEYEPAKGVRQNVWTKKYKVSPGATERSKDAAFSNSTPAPFAKALEKAKNSSDEAISWRVTAYDPEEYIGKKLHITPGGSTIAVTQDGDIVSLCKAAGDPASGRDIVAEAVKNGGIKLDSYAGNHRFYQLCGFEPVSWCEWVEDYAPDDWRPEFGRENIVFYRYTGVVPEIPKSIQEFYAATPASSSYDEAKALRDKIIKGG